MVHVNCAVLKFLNGSKFNILMKLLALILSVVATYGVSAQCSAPTGLLTTGITATAGTATWAPVNGATSYNVEYKPASSSTWTSFGFGTSGLQWTLSGLQANTSYDWRVRADCNSSYTQTQFTTGAIGSCSAPGGLSTSNINSSTATMNWSPVSGAFAYTVEYRATSSNSWLTAASATYSTSYNLYGLSAATSYEWRVYANCSFTEVSSYSTAQFTTSGSTTPTTSACPGPYDVSTNGTISGAAAISVNTDIKGTVARKNDIDHYKFTINSGGTINVFLTTLPANYNLAVLNSSGTQIGISQNNGTQSESIALNVAPGIYYAKVFPKGTANKLTSCYTLRVQTVTATRITATVTEPANTAIEVTMNPNFTINLFPNPAGDQLNVSVEGVDNKTEIKVYNLMGKLVMQQESSNPLIQLNISKLSAGFYMVHVNDGGETRSAKFRNI